MAINPTKAELNRICHLLTLLEAHQILHVSRIRVNPLKILPLASNTLIPSFLPLSEAVLEVLFRECL